MKRAIPVVHPFIALAMAALSLGAQAQETYPSRPVRIITPYAAGSSTDIIARLIGPKLTDAWGQPVVVESRPGGNTVIGSDAMVKSRPDGYTLLLVSSTHVLNGLLMRNLPYDTQNDFAPVATIARSELVQVVNPTVPAASLQEFIAYAKSKPGRVTFASSSTGGPTHLAAEMLGLMTGITLQHVPYKGAGAAMADLVGGHVDMHFSAPISVMAHLRSGKLRAIAISGEARSPALPQVPTFTEAGLPGFNMGFWYGLLAPAATPRPVIDRLSTEMARVLALPDIKEKLAGQGANPFVSTPDQFAAMLRADAAKYDKVIRSAKIRLDN